MASIMRALLVTAVVRKMNLSPAGETPLRAETGAAAEPWPRGAPAGCWPRHRQPLPPHLSPCPGTAEPPSRRRCSLPGRRRGRRAATPRPGCPPQRCLDGAQRAGGTPSPWPSPTTRPAQELPETENSLPLSSRTTSSRPSQPRRSSTCRTGQAVTDQPQPQAEGPLLYPPEGGRGLQVLRSGSQAHLLNDLAAQGGVGPAEHVRHVPRHFQVIFSIYPGNLQRWAIPWYRRTSPLGLLPPPQRCKRARTVQSKPAPPDLPPCAQRDSPGMVCQGWKHHLSSSPGWRLQSSGMTGAPSQPGQVWAYGEAHHDPQPRGETSCLPGAAAP